MAPFPPLVDLHSPVLLHVSLTLSMRTWAASILVSMNKADLNFLIQIFGEPIFSFLR